MATGYPSRLAMQASLPAVIVLDHVRSMYNAGAFFRTADAAAIEKLCLCGITAHPPQPGVSKTALGAEQSVPWEYFVDSLIPIRIYKARGYEIAAIETGPDAIDLFDWRPRFPVCVVFGNEVDGLAPDLLSACGAHVRLPMLGTKNSLNVATAGGIVAYELMRKFRQVHLP
ncbi:MAG: TrmH family RNA methyltransferase [Candidatus Solibacter sp.]|nr:TrmH family RNA methyltransferase [Candidatus Solibacter sp.]